MFHSIDVNSSVSIDFSSCLSMQYTSNKITKTQIKIFRQNIF